MSKTKVMIVDDQAMPRKLFELYVQSSERYELVHSIESAAFADVYMLGERVDLILMDILMSDGSSGLAAAEKIRQSFPKVKIIAVTSMPEPSWIERARAIGIDSFWYKESKQETILEVMDRTMAGEQVYPDRIPDVQLGEASAEELTGRELDVLRVLITGASNAEIGAQIGMTEGTVKTHLNHIMYKTGCHSRTELAVKARSSGLVIDEDTV